MSQEILSGLAILSIKNEMLRKKKLNIKLNE
jgi:hypothetical protein